MRLKFFCPRWGSEGVAWPVFLRQVQAAGFDGVEWAIPADTKKELIDEVVFLALEEGLHLIAQHYDTNDADYHRHLANFAIWLKKVRAYPWYRISSQTGKDYFNRRQNERLISLAGKDVLHETHRGKFSFAAHLTKEYLTALPDLRLTLDLSHWCTVAESFLEDQALAVQLAIGRTDHIHARVGYPEGPQVSDPCAPEWREALNAHLAWWDEVVAIKKRLGQDLSFTTEFGPFPYMVQLPGTQQPVASQWDINIFMLNLLKDRYA